MKQSDEQKLILLRETLTWLTQRWNKGEKTDEIRDHMQQIRDEIFKIMNKKR